MPVPTSPLPEDKNTNATSALPTPVTPVFLVTDVTDSAPLPLSPPDGPFWDLQTDDAPTPAPLPVIPKPIAPPNVKPISTIAPPAVKPAAKYPAWYGALIGIGVVVWIAVGVKAIGLLRTTPPAPIAPARQATEVPVVKAAAPRIERRVEPRRRKAKIQRKRLARRPARRSRESHSVILGRGIVREAEGAIIHIRD